MRPIRSNPIGFMAATMLPVACLLFLTPVGALAQSYTAILEPMPYSPLPSREAGSESVEIIALNGTGATLPLPFPVEFFGQTYSSVNVLGIGMVTFGDVYTTTPAADAPGRVGQREIPGDDPATPHGFIAFWWDELACGSLTTQVVGMAPNRHYVLEWANCRHAATSQSRLNAQVKLPESGGDIEVRYGPIVDPDHVFGGAVGIEDEQGTAGAAGLSIDGAVCNPDCRAADFPTDHRIVYRTTGTVSIRSAAVDPVAITIGYPATFHSVVSNRTAEDLHDATVRYGLSPSSDASLAEEIATVTGLSIPAGTDQDVPLTIDTGDLTPGTYYLVAELDPFGEVLPAPIRPAVAGPVVVEEPTAELWIFGDPTAPPWVEPGAPFFVRWEVRNSGLLDAVDAEYMVLLTHDPTLADPTKVSLMASGTFSLASMDRLSFDEAVHAPLESGYWWIVVLIDTGEEIPPTRPSGRIRAIPIVVSVALKILNTDLPDGRVGETYDASLIAMGGVGDYDWSVDPGALPPGLTMTGSRFTGVPTTSGIFPFTVTVRSAAFLAIADVSITIGEARPPPLKCGDPEGFGPMQVGRSIDPIRLSATGGEAPYTWSSVSGGVPGLDLSVDGVITGTPTEAGTWGWALEVADVHGRRATCPISIDVMAAPEESELQITTRELPWASAGEAYEVRLEASGATGTLTWSLGTEGGLPEGLVLTEDGLVTGVPTLAALAGEGRRTFLFEVTAHDAAQKEASATLSLELVEDRPAGPTVVTRKKGGCQSASGDVSLLGLALALGVASLIRGRRRR